MKVLKYPFSEKEIRSLKAGDAVSISGLIHTGRDKFHKAFADGMKIDVDFKDGAIYHCGPVVVRNGDEWHVVAAGPTTSVRENPYEPAFIAASGVRIVIGKGGMNEATLAAMKKHGCVYVQAVGGAAALYAACVKCVAGVSYLKEFGAAEACWHFDVENFEGVVAMDANGVSLFDEVIKSSSEKAEKLTKE
jgi:fumarate hydratase class I